MTNKNDEVENFRVELLQKIHEVEFLSESERFILLSLMYNLEVDFLNEEILILKNEK